MFVDAFDTFEGAVFDLERDWNRVRIVDFFHHLHGFCHNGAIGYRLFVLFFVFPQPVLESYNFGSLVSPGRAQGTQKGAAQLVGNVNLLSGV